MTNSIIYTLEFGEADNPEWTKRSGKWRIEELREKLFCYELIEVSV